MGSRELAHTMHPAQGPCSSATLPEPLALAMMLYRLARKLSQRQVRLPAACEHCTGWIMSVVCVC